MKRITIKDVARQLGVNASTVSRALNNHPDVSDDTREAIRKTADKMGYKPNLTAVNLRKGHSKLLALIIPEISMFFFPSVIRAVEEAAHQKGYNLLVLHSNDNLQREMENTDICANMGVDGVLASLTRQSTDVEHFMELTYADIPVVFYDKTLEGDFGHSVVIPSQKAAFDATERLLAMQPNAQNVCGIFGDPRLSITQERVDGFNQAIKLADNPSMKSQLHFAATAEDANQILKNLWLSKNRPDSLFCMSDEVLAGVMRAAGKLKIQIPEQLSVIAMSDGLLPPLLTPNVPYIETSGSTVGAAAVELLFELIQQKNLPTQTRFVPTPFVI